MNSFRQCYLLAVYICRGSGGKPVWRDRLRRIGNKSLQGARSSLGRIAARRGAG
jgi:hypothetical protein